MRIENRKPSTSTTFGDASTGEQILQMASDENGLFLMAFHLYDAEGALVLDSDGLRHYPQGLVVRSAGGEVLLDVPPDAADDVHYRLYNSGGTLLTKSDGARTMIGPLLRMAGVGRNWAPPVASPAPGATAG